MRTGGGCRTVDREISRFPRKERLGRTLPTGTGDNGALLVHCLDVDQPIAANLAAEESVFIRALGHD
jgi:hypothetical protein